MNASAEKLPSIEEVGHAILTAPWPPWNHPHEVIIKVVERPHGKRVQVHLHRKREVVDGDELFYWYYPGPFTS